MIHVKTNVDRPTADAVLRLSKFSSATIHEAQGRKGALSSKIKPVDRSMSFCGPALTVSCAPRDNLMLQVAIHYAEPGDVVLVAAGEFEEAGTFGDVLGNAMKAKGLAAMVTDSGVRDTQDLIELGLPVFSGSVSIKGTVKETIGPINHPVIFGDEIIYPGDILRGDADGVVVVRKDEVEDVIRLSQERDDAERDLIRRYHEGGTTIELCNLTEVLKAKGLLVEDAG
ncbi:MAG TPA: S-adenosylmethionine--2-demethylmenaquinone methyltransferase [Arthrobacter bacterium]|jgi:4-hydroxy-4-methyl-2-oxoglutarate aldolase|nr:S-adenosylmethionine--2-demethylmenaquinone methyltransferase [Arthrobacter sp.]HAP90854.1 S-adenosylmethionine--2-demethylmenaquinone methyltransferase [Arthrobacter sp.]HBH56951.1 S-adenosylmethionine--2-demethylmenaquinone methyltransferase [Arthrobacter sp.]HCB58398.1 S-adenosylmethionine--2-demethylmenaquinone methyltransferase [Arthrobacter sp.]HCC41345.1 S-adenosylmethionine--2-demethylmenaquinone methyltransferase [Arthrobacter sp.]